jgi:hypothetical protein
MSKNKIISRTHGATESVRAILLVSRQPNDRSFTRQQITNFVNNKTRPNTKPPEQQHAQTNVGSSGAQKILWLGHGRLGGS